MLPTADVHEFIAKVRPSSTMQVSPSGPHWISVSNPNRHTWAQAVPNDYVFTECECVDLKKCKHDDSCYCLDMELCRICRRSEAIVRDERPRPQYPEEIQEIMLKRIRNNERFSEADKIHYSKVLLKLGVDNGTRLRDGDGELLLEAGNTSGKWMLFPTGYEVDAVWARIAKATVAGKLGVAAKVATSRRETVGDSSKTYLICVYLHDFRRKDCVYYLLQQLFTLGFDVRTGFKADILTLLNINSGNIWSLPPVFYSKRTTKKMVDKSKGIHATEEKKD